MLVFFCVCVIVVVCLSYGWEMLLVLLFAWYSSVWQRIFNWNIHHHLHLHLDSFVRTEHTHTNEQPQSQSHTLRHSDTQTHWNLIVEMCFMTPIWFMLQNKIRQNVKHNQQICKNLISTLCVLTFCNSWTGVRKKNKWNEFTHKHTNNHTEAYLPSIIDINRTTEENIGHTIANSCFCTSSCVEMVELW